MEIDSEMHREVGAYIPFHVLLLKSLRKKQTRMSIEHLAYRLHVPAEGYTKKGIFKQTYRLSSLVDVVK